LLICATVSAGSNRGFGTLMLSSDGTDTSCDLFVMSRAL